MTKEPLDPKPVFAGIKLRRIDADHYTEHDFEMERLGREQSAETYAERLKVLEAHGWVPFRGPFYYARREFHGGHHPPSSKKRVPTTVAFAMFKEANPEVELPAYKPHPYGWRPPVEQMPFKTELISVEPMRAPAFKLLDYKAPETEHDHQQKRWEEFCSQFDGVRSTGISYLGRARGGGTAMYVLLEHDGDVTRFPKTWEGSTIDIRVKPEAEERAEKEVQDAAAQKKYQEEAAWLVKARSTR